MDYKALIERLRDENNCDVLDYIDDAAAAIETLLAERDTAIADIQRCCATCAHFVILHNGCTPDYDCKNPECRNVSGVNTGWEWRGPADRKEAQA